MQDIISDKLLKDKKVDTRVLADIIAEKAKYYSLKSFYYSPFT
jgi:hypothetical protein